MHVYNETETDVTANKADYFTIYEDGERRVIVPKDDTDYTITIANGIEHGTVTADKTTAKAGELVTLTVTPESGYGLQSLTVKDASDNDVSLSNRKFIMPKGGVTVSATFVQTTAAFDEVTGVLTLNGNVDADEVKAYGAVIDDSDGIEKFCPVTSVVCEPGTVLPADCSEMFMKFRNESNNLTIDLSNADVSGVTNMSKMFGRESLTTIYVNSAWSMANVTSSEQMFRGCERLIGGNETMWEDIKYFNGAETAMSSTYAVIDGIDGQRGYLTHKKGTPVITTAPSVKTDLVYNGDEQELITAGTTNFGDFLSYSLDGENYSADIPTGTAAGTYTVYYKVEGSDNWNKVEAQSITVTIDKATPTVTSPKAKTLTYTGSAQELVTAGITDKGTLLYSLDGNDYSDNIPKAKDAGKYTVYYKVDEQNYWYEPKTLEVTIAKATPTVTAPVAVENLVYNDNEQELVTAGITDKGTLLYSLDGKNYSSNIPKGTYAGKYTVYYKVDEQNYWYAQKTLEVTIDKATLYVKTAPTTSAITYGQTLNDSTLNDGVIQYSKNIETEVEGTFAWKDSTLKPSVADSEKTKYEVTFTPIDSNNYESVTMDVTLKVNKVTPTVTAPKANTLTYSGSEQELVTAGSTNFGKVLYSLDGTNYSENIPKAKNVGNYIVSYTVEGTDNWNAVEAQSITVTIGKATPTVTSPKAKTLTYTGSAQELVTAGSSTFGTVLYSLDGKTYSESIPKAVNAGEYKVYYKVDGTDNWNAVEAASVNITIKKATPSYDKPDDKEITCMQTLKDIELPKGFSFANVGQELSVGVNEVKLTFTPEDTDNYEVINDITIKVISNHTFDKEIAEEKYLKSEATCTDKAVYYKSCECGEKGTDTFEYGEALGHDYADVTYTWSHDGKTCTAKAICTRKECKDDTEGHTVTETVQSTGKETKAATCEEKGITTYTATFENESFETQTKEVADIDAKGHRYGITTYEWSEDGKTCTATSVCSNDSTHKITETAIYEPDKADSQIKATVKEAATTEKMGTTTYTATFKNAEMFKVQTKDVVDIPKVEVTDNPSDIPSDNPTDNPTDKPSDTPSDKPTDKPSDNPSKPTDTTNSTDTTKPSDTTKTDGNTSSNDTTKDTSVTSAPKEEGAKLPVSDTKAEYVVNSKAGEEPAVEYKPAADVADKTVTVPESVTVEGVTYAVNEIADNAFKGNKTVESVVIPKSVKEIGDNAFSGCTKLKSVTIPGSVTEIGDKAFSGCTNLKSVKIPESVTEIGDKAFSGCKKLNSVTIGKNVAEIGDSAFVNCSALTKATLPANVTKLGSNIFKGCKKLKTITIKTKKLTSKNIAKNAFKGVGNKVTIKVPKKMKKAYTKLLRKKGLSKKVKIK